MNYRITRCTIVTIALLLLMTVAKTHGCEFNKLPGFIEEMPYNGGKVILMGTVHADSLTYQRRLKDLSDCVRKVNALYVEVSDNPPVCLPCLEKNLNLPNIATLLDTSTANITEIENQLIKHGFPLPGGQTPLLQLTTLLQGIEVSKAVAAVAQGLSIDQKYINAAKKNQIRIYSLETIKYQQEAYYSASLDDQKAIFNDALVDAASGAIYKHGLIIDKAFLSGNYAILKSELQDTCFDKTRPHTMRLCDKLYSKRNEIMASILKSKLIKDETAIVAIGIGHFLTANSLQYYLRKMDW